MKYERVQRVKTGGKREDFVEGRGTGNEVAFILQRLEDTAIWPQVVCHHFVSDVPPLSVFLERMLSGSGVEII